MLEKLHMDSECVIRNCCDNFNVLYWLRCGKKFRHSQFREDVALAISIYNHLVRLGVPRPPDHIAQLCGLEHSGDLYQITRILRISDSEKVTFFCGTRENSF